MYRKLFNSLTTTHHLLITLPYREMSRPYRECLECGKQVEGEQLICHICFEGYIRKIQRAIGNNITQYNTLKKWIDNGFTFIKN